MDFAVSGLGATLENGLQDLGQSIAISPDGMLMGIAGKGGAWASKSDTLGRYTIQTSKRYCTSRGLLHMCL
jgi:hypothetical protein